MKSTVNYVPRMTDHGVEEEEDCIRNSGRDAGRAVATWPAQGGALMFRKVLGWFGDTAAAPQQERTQPPMPVIEGTISGIDNSAPIAGSRGVRLVMMSSGEVDQTVQRCTQS
jgi:hypothetical protein